MHRAKEELLTGRCYELLSQFYGATSALRERFERNERMWEGHYLGDEQAARPDEPHPMTPVIFSTCESLLSDICDYYPQPLLLGQEPGDDSLAQELSEIVRYVFKRRNYRKLYREKVRSALIKGTSVQEVYWDSQLYSGLGDIAIREWDIKNFYFDPLYEDIQKGRACFKVARLPKEWFLERYPKAAAGMKPDALPGLSSFSLPYVEADSAMLIEYWYKEPGDDGQERVHMAKVAGGVVLEDSRDVRPDGLYEHGLYPFVVEPLYRLQGRPWGLGLVDVFSETQKTVDRLDELILKNAYMSSKLKLLVDRSADIDADALTDYDREVVRAGRIDESALRWFSAQPLNPVVYSHYNAKINSIKEESGQNQMARGDGLRNVTAASAIIALQEAGSKRSRMLVQQLYDGYEELTRLILKFIAQFYTEERRFLIRGAKDDREIVFSSRAKRRDYDFDISVSAQKQTPVEAAYRNELAMQLMQLSGGLFTPIMAVEMMDFEGKESVLESMRIRERELMEEAMQPEYAMRAAGEPDEAYPGPFI